MEFIAPQSLKRQIADEIRRRIICGEVEFGQKLSENSFAAELGVKRTPVREAFILLQGESLVDIVPQKGTFVFALTEDEIRQICELRILLESASLEIARRRSRDDCLAEMAAVLDRHARALEADDAAGCEREDSNFHELIVRHAGNRYFSSSYAMIGDRAEAIRFRTTVRTYAHLAGILDVHRRIFRLFEADDMTACLETLKRHVYSTLERVVGDPQVYERVLQRPFPGGRSSTGLF